MDLHDNLTDETNDGGLVDEEELLLWQQVQNNDDCKTRNMDCDRIVSNDNDNSIHGRDSERASNDDWLENQIASPSANSSTSSTAATFNKGEEKDIVRYSRNDLLEVRNSKPSRTAPDYALSANIQNLRLWKCRGSGGSEETGKTWKEKHAALKCKSTSYRTTTTGNVAGGIGLACSGNNNGSNTTNTSLAIGGDISIGVGVGLLDNGTGTTTTSSSVGACISTSSGGGVHSSIDLNTNNGNGDTNGTNNSNKDSISSSSTNLSQRCMRWYQPEQATLNNKKVTRTRERVVNNKWRICNYTSGGNGTTTTTVSTVSGGCSSSTGGSSTSQTNVTSAKSYMDNRSISSSHLMPAFAKKHIDSFNAHVPTLGYLTGSNNDTGGNGSGSGSTSGSGNGNSCSGGVGFSSTDIDDTTKSFKFESLSIGKHGDKSGEYQTRQNIKNTSIILLIINIFLYNFLLNFVYILY